MNWIERRKRLARRRWTLRLLGGALVLFGILLTAGLALPAAQTRRATVILDRTPEIVWRLLTDLDGMPGWRSDLRALERLPDLNGHPAWREVGPQGARVVQLLVVERLQRLVMRRADGSGGARRTIELTQPEGSDGTRVTVTEEEAVGNPLRRVLTRLPIPRDPAPRFLRDLAARLGGRPPIALAPTRPHP